MSFPLQIKNFKIFSQALQQNRELSIVKYYEERNFFCGTQLCGTEINGATHMLFPKSV
jgi:hypothetical protein